MRENNNEEIERLCQIAQSAIDYLKGGSGENSNDRHRN